MRIDELNTDLRPGQHKIKCPQCGPTRKPQNRHDTPLSVRVSETSAVWTCHNCGYTGSSGARGGRDRLPYLRPPAIDSRPISAGLETWFQKRGISREIIERFGIHVSETSFGGEPERCIAFPYLLAGDLVNVKYRSADKRFRQSPQAQRTLYNADEAAQNKSRLVWVEGEMDVLACAQAGIVAVTLPDGAPKEARFNPDDARFDAIRSHAWLDEVVDVIIATDADTPGQALAEELVHRFGRDRCRRVRWPDGVKDANDLLLRDGPAALVAAIDAAEPYPIEGLYRVDNYLDDVKNIWAGNIQRPLSTGFPLLDQIYKIQPGTFHVITGVPNHGKSNFLDQIMINMAMLHSWKFAVFSPEHSTPQHLRRLSEKVVQKPFDPGPSERISEQELSASLAWLNEQIYFIESHDKIPTVDWLLSKARAAVTRYGVRGFIIDPYNEIDARREGNKREDEHIRDLISSCKSFCRAHDIVIWMVAHPSKMQRAIDGAIPPPTLYDVSGAAHWNNMADVGIVVHRDFDADVTRVITRKIREQGLYGTIGEAQFRFDIVKRVYVEVNPTAPVYSYHKETHAS